MDGIRGLGSLRDPSVCMRVGILHEVALAFRLRRPRARWSLCARTCLSPSRSTLCYVSKGCNGYLVNRKLGSLRNALSHASTWIEEYGEHLKVRRHSVLTKKYESIERAQNTDRAPTRGTGRRSYGSTGDGTPSCTVCTKNALSHANKWNQEYGGHFKVRHHTPCSPKIRVHRTYTYIHGTRWTEALVRVDRRRHALLYGSHHKNALSHAST